MQETQARLSRVERRLKQIEREDTLPIYDVVIKNIAEQWIASAREVIPSLDAVAQRCTFLADAVHSAIVQSGIKIVGPWGAIYHDAIDDLYIQRPTDVEMAIVIDPSSVKKYGTWQHELVRIHALSGSPSMACLVHTNDYEGLWDAYAAMLLWIATNGYQIVGSCRVFYLHFMTGQDHPVSELQIPVEKVLDTLDISDTMHK